MVRLLPTRFPAYAALERAVNIDDLRHLARKRAPRPVFDYVDGGADGEVTLRDNRRSWDAILFRPRNAVHVPQPDLRVSVLGSAYAMPFLLAPIGFSRLLHAQGEPAVAAAEGRQASGSVCRASPAMPAKPSRPAPTRRCGISSIRGRARGDRSDARACLARRVHGLGRNHRYERPRNRERDLHNGVPVLMSGNYLRMLPYVPAMLRRPRWTAQFLADRDAMFFPNIQLPGKGACPAADVRAMLTGAVVTWADFPGSGRRGLGRFLPKACSPRTTRTAPSIPAARA